MSAVVFKILFRVEIDFLKNAYRKPNARQKVAAGQCPALCGRSFAVSCPETFWDGSFGSNQKNKEKKCF